MKPWEVMKAHEEGAEIECLELDSKELGWSSSPVPLWDWFDFDYRVKPSPKPPRIVPFTRETWPRGDVWFRGPDGTDRRAVVISDDGVNYFGFDVLLKNYKLLEIRDGKVVGERPCGREVRDE